jgi:prevent-host-death family protein
MTVSVTDFKSRCLSLFDTLGKQADVIVVTKRGKPIAKILPASDNPEDEPWKHLQGTVRFTCNDMFAEDDVWEDY